MFLSHFGEEKERYNVHSHENVDAVERRLYPGPILNDSVEHDGYQYPQDCKRQSKTEKESGKWFLEESVQSLSHLSFLTPLFLF